MEVDVSWEKTENSNFPNIGIRLKQLLQNMRNVEDLAYKN